MRMIHRECVISILSHAILFLASSVATADESPMPSVQPGTLGRDVNPFIGTGGMAYLCGNNFPGASLPFGMVRLSPDTISAAGTRATNSSGYYYRDSRILGFSHTRLVGTGATDGGNFLVIPTDERESKSHSRGMNVSFSHENERAFPGYYGLKLTGMGITAELTSTQRVGVHRYTFERDKKPRILIQVTNALGKGICRDGEVRILPETNEVEGCVTNFGTFAKRYGGLKTYFVAKFDKKFDGYQTRLGDAVPTDHLTVKGDDIGVGFSFAEDERNQVQMKLAISYVSVTNARANLEAEAGNATFDEVLNCAVETWEKILGRIQVSGGSEKHRRIFRTALYRAFQMPTAFNDVNGDYLGFDHKIHKADGFTYYTDLSLWDTFRTVHPLYNLIARSEQGDMIVSLLKMYEQGGYLPRWPSGGGYTGSMFGTPADIVIAESYLKGIRNFDVESAFAAMKKTALSPVPASAPYSGRVGVEHYLKHEYCPSDLMKKSVASTIEYSYADQAIARIAEALGHEDDAELFKKHGTFYRNLWNPETQFFQPRESTGKFSDDFRPELLTYVDFGGKFTHAYVEGSAWQWRWGVASDGLGVISLFKSREAFVDQLDQFFARSPAGVGLNPNAYYWQGNQPDLHAGYLFNQAGRPDLTQKWVRWVLETKYGDQENGLDGNDDGGTLSAWYVLSSLGMFPIAGTDEYELTSPLWDRSLIDLDNRKLEILAEKSAMTDTYIQTIARNGGRFERTNIRHSEIGRGGTLRFELGPSATDR